MLYVAGAWAKRTRVRFEVTLIAFRLNVFDVVSAAGIDRLLMTLRPNVLISWVWTGRNVRPKSVAYCASRRKRQQLLPIRFCVTSAVCGHSGLAAFGALVPAVHAPVPRIEARAAAQGTNSGKRWHTIGWSSCIGTRRCSPGASYRQRFAVRRQKAVGQSLK